MVEKNQAERNLKIPIKNRKFHYKHPLKIITFKDNCLQKSKLAKSLGNAINQKDGLMNFLNDGNIALSNNLAENSMPQFMVGRRNWLFFSSPEIAAASAAVYSIVETAKANGLNAYEYLRYIYIYLYGVHYEEEL